MDNEMITKRAFFLAYEASPVMGMGILQARDGITEDQVWAEVHHGDEKTADGDYVLGRMMKLGISWSDSSITVTRGRNARPDYQGWAGTYHSSADLLEAAMDSLTQPVKVWE